MKYLRIIWGDSWMSHQHVCACRDDRAEGVAAMKKSLVMDLLA